MDMRSLFKDIKDTKIHLHFYKIPQLTVPAVCAKTS